MYASLILKLVFLIKSFIKLNGINWYVGVFKLATYSMLGKGKITKKYAQIKYKIKEYTISTLTGGIEPYFLYW